MMCFRASVLGNEQRRDNGFWQTRRKMGNGAPPSPHHTLVLLVVTIQSTPCEEDTTVSWHFSLWLWHRCLLHPHVYEIGRRGCLLEVIRFPFSDCGGRAAPHKTPTDVVNLESRAKGNVGRSLGCQRPREHSHTERGNDHQKFRKSAVKREKAISIPSYEYLRLAGLQLAPLILMQIGRSPPTDVQGMIVPAFCCSTNTRIQCTRLSLLLHSCPLTFSLCLANSVGIRCCCCSSTALLPSGK